MPFKVQISKMQKDMLFKDKHAAQNIRYVILPLNIEELDVNKNEFVCCEVFFTKETQEAKT